MKQISMNISNIFILILLLLSEVSSENNTTLQRNLFGTYIKNSDINCPNIKHKNSSEVRCTKCESLKYCKSLNGKYVQEVYYPFNTDRSETCAVIEQLGIQTSKEVFGKGKSFRDSDICRG
jgi:hypothetical protein